jgi:hypothetical protein
MDETPRPIARIEWIDLGVMGEPMCAHLRRSRSKGDRRRFARNIITA